MAEQSKAIEELLKEQNRLLAEQNDLLRAQSAAANIEEIRARARRNTPWGTQPPTWAR